MAASAQTYTPKTNTPPQSSFGNMRVDGQHAPMLVGNGIQTQDATGSPVVSPLAVPSASVTTINVPASAIKFNIIPLTNTVNISEKDNTVATNYLTAPTGVVTSIDCANMSVIYLKANTGAATGSSFWFIMVN